MTQQADTTKKTQPSSKAMNFAMMACCVIMLLPIAGFLLAGGAAEGLGANLLTFAPLLLCVGGHFVMHKMMGKTCHSSDPQSDSESANVPSVDGVSSVPKVRRG